MRRFLGPALFAAALLVEHDARAYCRSSTCSGGTGGTCMASTSVETCDVDLPLQWPAPCVSFDVATAASVDWSWATADSILETAFKSWTRVDCGGGVGPSIQAFDFGGVSCTTVEYNQAGGNANILIFRDTTWPHDAGGGGADVLALTTVTYDVGSGDIYDADIEVNTQALLEAAGGTEDNNDALSDALTHEVGHFFGLAHSALAPNLKQPTMYWQFNAGERTLAADDKLSICTAYPPNRVSDGACTAIPRHGWAPECFDDQTYLTCAASPLAHPLRHGGAFVGVGMAGALAVVVARRRRRRAGGDNRQGAKTPRKRFFLASWRPGGSSPLPPRSHR